jgi:hypothetical protein
MARSLIRQAFAASLLLAGAMRPAAADLLVHDGFETCWVTAQTRAQFLESIRSSIDGTSACIPTQTGSQSGIDYTVCGNANGCGIGVAGCPVAIQAGPFSGDFSIGHFVGPGTASDIVVPISTTALGSCNVNLTDINLGYTLDYLVQTDGIDGVYTLDMLTPAVAIASYSTSNDCNPALAALISSYVPQAIGQAEVAAAAAIEPGLRANTLERAVCPLSVP